MTRANRFLGFALSAFVLSGCATQRELISSQLWPWKQKDVASQGLTADLAKPFPVVPRSMSAKAESQFEFSHPLIDQQISRFQEDQHGFYERALGRSARYVPVMEVILQRKGVPKELALLPLVESGYELNAVSPAGAVGPWQFMYATAIRYGLRVDKNVDERRDPIKATEAAASYLRDLYDMFEDWHLAIAAYNTGEGNIGRAIQNTGAETFWELVDKGVLYAETEAYLPRFLAASQIAKAPEIYGFETPEPDPLVYDWVRVSRPMPLSKVAEMSGVDIDDIKELNPALRRRSVPPSGYIVKLPKGSKRTYQEAVNQVDPSLAAWNPRRSTCVADDGVYCVEAGDTVASIAAHYGISARELLEANGKRNNRLQEGDTLAIPGRAPRNDDPDDDDDDNQRADQPAKRKNKVHTIAKGESPAIIARRYGISLDDLLRTNGIRDARGLQVGQKLQLPRDDEKSAPAAQAKTTKKVTFHTLAKGETPASVAKAYGVPLKDLLRANGIRDARSLKAGKKLRLPARATVASNRNAKPAQTAQSPKQVNESAKAIAPRPAAKVAAAAPMPAPRTHVVKKGDTPASIAKRHNVSAAALLKANRLRDSRGLKPGQKLTVPPSQRAEAGKSRSDG